jgi:hypothetical protein
MVRFDTRDFLIIGGTWHDPYSGNTVTHPGDLDIDHLVPLANAHVSGGWTWDPERKRAIYAWRRDRLQRADGITWGDTAEEAFPYRGRTALSRVSCRSAWIARPSQERCIMGPI